MECKAALYGRVSTEHEEQQESIAVQKEALLKYSLEKGFDIVGLYFDEGCTGTSFDRPEMNRLKRDVENKKVNIVIVKDLSRIGRNNPLTLLFLDYLAERDVRLIAVNDNYDTEEDPDDLVGIKTWFNERYSKELSRKIKFSLEHKKRKGEYLTAFAPFGYKKSLKEKNKLEVDSFAAGVVKDIFNLYINGLGFAKIAKLMEEKGIPNPSQYGVYSRKSDRWDSTTIKSILKNPVYLGHCVQQKYYKKNFKTKSIYKMPESGWIVVKDTHTPIIDEATYNLVKQIMERRRDKYRCGPGEPHLFTSFVFCHECGNSLYYKEDKNGRGVYRCGRYVKYGSKSCTSHFIREDELKAIIESELKQIIADFVNTEALAQEIKREYPQREVFDRQLKNVDKLISANNNKIEALYRDKLNGICSEEMFVKMTHEIKLIISKLKEQKQDIIRSLECIKEKDSEGSGFIKYVKSIMGMDMDIDREILERFIRRVEICNNGDVIIDFNFFVS